MHYFRSTWTSVISTWNIHRKLALPYGNNPWHMDLEFHNLGRGAMDIIGMHLVVLKYVWKQSKTFYKILYIFTKWWYWPRPRAQTSDTGIIHLTIYEDDFMDIINMHLVLFFFIYCGSKEDFLRCNILLLYYHNDPGLWREPLTKGSWFYNFSTQHYREHIYAFSFSKIFILWEKMITFLDLIHFPYMAMFAWSFVFL